MPKRAKELSAVEVKRLTKPGLHAVGIVSGLLLCVKDTGARSWILRTMIGNKRRVVGLGAYPEITVAKARDRARAIKEDIRHGIDPIAEKRKARLGLNASMTFAQAARSFFEIKQTEFRNKKHIQNWISSIESHVNPAIGRIPVNEIELPHVLAVLEPIWHEKTETATRIRQRIEAILSWATVAGYRKGDNPARWRGHLDSVLPKPTKLKKVKHFAALPWREMGSFMAELRKRDGMAARALEFIILTAARSGEARLATWVEIDLDGKVWTIPAERMKAGKEHVVPLSDQAVMILEELPRLQDSPYVFFAARGGPLSDMSISAVCRRMNIAAVPHGFRSTFRDWCSESTNFPREVAEKALAHAIDSKTEAAYRRGDLLDKRRKLMQSWADYCDKAKGLDSKVAPIRKKEATAR